MRRLPYGYCLVRGNIAVDTESAARLLNFFQRYLSGMSIESARLAAGIDMSSKACRDMLTNRAYLGTDMLPKIVDEKLLDAAGEALALRGAHLRGRTTRKVLPRPIPTDFTVKWSADCPDKQDAITYAAWLYRTIQPAKCGRQ